MTDALDILLKGAGDSAAAARLRQSGLPTPKLEDWKFTSLRPLEKFLAEGGTAGKPLDVPAPLAEGAAQIVIRNGRLESAPHDVNGVSVNSTDTATEPREGSAVADMVAALAGGALGLAIERNAVIDKPVELVFLSDGSAGPAQHVSVAIDAGENSEALLIERHLGDGGYLNAQAVTVTLGQNARLRHIKVQDESAAGFHLADLDATLGRDASYHRFILSLGARLARDEVHATCAGEGAELRLLGAYAGADEQHLDHTTRIDHAVPRTTSHEVYKGVLDDSARGVFQGGVLVRPDAQKTDGHQMNKALLLSPKAEIDSKPALEIYADDVKCSHGATAGEIEADQLFYLRARGIPDKDARALLVQAFLDEIFDDIRNEDLREALIARLHAKLDREDGARG
ncbi:MAG: Fe-S cluster assembly protein SufD [Minwuia sp.]|uniref:Fe-S cluster assembly protein SufD n=1 Tax=Minwuia sp. TaxID=2493630 RepID=UPI003A8C2462